MHRNEDEFKDYTANDVVRWREESAGLTGAMKNLYAQMKQVEHDVKRLSDTIQAQEVNAIEFTRKNIAALKAQIHVLTLRAQIENYQKDLAECICAANVLSQQQVNTQNNPDLNQKIKLQRDKWEKLHSGMTSARNNLDDLIRSAGVHASNEDSGNLQWQVAEEERRLKTFESARDQCKAERLKKVDELSWLRDQYQAKLQRQLQLMHVLRFEDIAQEFAVQLSQMNEHMDHKVQQLHLCGSRVLHRIREIQKRAALDPLNKYFDLVQHTAILESCQQLLTNPADEDAARQLALLIKNTDDGKPSVPKKVVGAILLFLGAAAMLAAGLGVFVATLGIGTPVSIGLGVGGAALFAGGVTLCVKGRDKGLHYQLGMFSKQSDRCARQNNSCVNASGRQDVDMLYVPFPVI